VGLAFDIKVLRLRVSGVGSRVQRFIIKGVWLWVGGVGSKICCLEFRV
jgi:hypothetical protein